MKIRATQKLLNVSGIKRIKDESPAAEDLPGEWYATLLSMKRPGKAAIHFLHYPTLISIIMPGRSLNKTLPLLSERISSLLKRHGFSKLEPAFEVQSTPEVFGSNYRRIAGYLNSMKYNVEYHLARENSLDDIDFDHIEDIHFDYLFGVASKHGKYLRPGKILMEIAEKLDR